MVVVQSLLDNLCRCICTTGIPACGDVSVDGGASTGGTAARVGRHGDDAVAGANEAGGEGGGEGAGGNGASAAPCSSSAAAAMAARLRGSVECGAGSLFGGGRGKGAAAAAAAAAEGGGGGGGGVPAAASSDVSSSRGSASEFAGAAMTTRPRPGATAAAAAGDRAMSRVPSPEAAEDREAKEALAAARKEAGRQTGRGRGGGGRRDGSASSARPRSQSRTGKRKAEIFRSRNNPSAAGGGSSSSALPPDPRDHDNDAEPAGGGNAYRRAAADAATATATANDQRHPSDDDDTDDEIAGLRNHVAAGGGGGVFLCSGNRGIGAGGDRGSRAGALGRMMLCFANPIRGSDDEDECRGNADHDGNADGRRNRYYVGAPCGAYHGAFDSPGGGGGDESFGFVDGFGCGRRGRKAARTSALASVSSSSSSAAAATRARPHDSSDGRRNQQHINNQYRRPKVRTIADDIEELEALEAERRAAERLERHEEELRKNGGRGEGASSSDDMPDADEMTAATYADETITSTLYYDAKLDKVVETEPRPPPMPLFRQFKVDVDEEKDDEIRRIVRNGSHKTLSIMQIWKSQGSSAMMEAGEVIGGGNNRMVVVEAGADADAEIDDIDADVDPPPRAIPTAQDVIGALHVRGNRAPSVTKGGVGAGPFRPAAHCRVTPEKAPSNRFVGTPLPPVQNGALEGRGGGGGGGERGYEDWRWRPGGVPGGKEVIASSSPFFMETPRDRHCDRHGHHDQYLGAGEPSFERRRRPQNVVVLGRGPVGGRGGGDGRDGGVGREGRNGRGMNIDPISLAVSAEV